MGAAMEIEKTLTLPADAVQVWALLLDPQAMGACVPGMESIEVAGPDEYVAVMRVKMAFISARFKLRTRIIERREPVFLLAEGTGEDATVASSLKQRTEMQLERRADGGTDLRLKVQVDLLGRMGTFGLSAMKTKADRLWDEFGVNLAARLAQDAPSGVGAPAPEPAAASLAGATDPATLTPESATGQPAQAVPTPARAVATPPPARQGLWPRLLRCMGVQPAIANTCTPPIVIELQRPDLTRVRIEWPTSDSETCARWLRETLR